MFEHNPNSPDLRSYYFYLFLKVKIALKEPHFRTVEEVTGNKLVPFHNALSVNQSLADKGISMLEHNPNLPDLPPYDFYVSESEK